MIGLRPNSEKLKMPIDLRTRQLAKIAVNHSIDCKPGQSIMISGGQESTPFLIELYKEILLKKAHPVVRFHLPNISDFFYKYATKEQLKKFPELFDYNIKKCHAYIGIDTETNTRELTSTDPKKISIRRKITKPISDFIVNSKPQFKRVTIAYPCIAHAQEAEMSLTEWENFVYQACLIDWKKFSKRLNKLKKKFKKNSQIHLKGKDVNLKFQVHGHLTAIDDGKENMPGGEIFMAPIRESVNGHIKFEYPQIYSGKRISGISLTFKDGKVTEFDAEQGKELLKILLETDENSSYVGEFGIGMNPNIKTYTNNLLFDEKIGGTIHLALGMAYKENGGGNDSAIHLDIVKDMTKARIILDNKVIQENGKWKI